MAKLIFQEFKIFGKIYCKFQFSFSIELAALFTDSYIYSRTLEEKDFVALSVVEEDLVFFFVKINIFQIKIINYI